MRPVCSPRSPRAKPTELAFWGLLLAALSTALLTAACRDAVAPDTRTSTRYAAPEAWTPGQICSDLGDTRVCWRDGAASLVTRVVPDGPAPPHGWRCGGDGPQRACEDRYRNASAFDCGTQRCLQVRPRMPDDGEWECVEMSGVVYCHSRAEAAGMQAGPMDLGWLCGPRRKGAPGERVCVDFDADRPSGTQAAGEQSCRFEPHFGVPQRSCAKTRALRVGSPCSVATTCPEGSRCSAGACLPERPDPGCFFDRDCDDGARCVFGSCRGA